MTDWGAAYPRAAGEAEIDATWRLHGRFMAEITTRAAGGRVLEVGVGTGAFIAALARAKVDVAGIDADAGLVARANALLGRGRVRAADAFCLPYPAGKFAVAYSQGLLEHYGDAQIGELLREQLRVAACVVASVPTDLWTGPAFPPERRLGVAEWRRLFEAAGQATVYSYWEGMMVCGVLHAH